MGAFLQQRRFVFSGLGFLLTVGLVLTVVWVLTPFPAQAQSRLEIFKLQNRTAEEMLPVVEPLLQGEGTVTGMGNQLIVRATPKNLDMIRRLLAQIDAPLRNLRITVKQGIATHRQRTEADVAADIPIAGGQGRVIIPPATAGGGGVSGVIGGDDGAVGARLNQRTFTADERHTQQVTTLEGRPATIHISQRVPYQTTITQGVGPFATRSQSIQFQDVATGFSVLPKVNGDVVVLEIHPQVSKLNPGSIEIQEVHTTASGKLGQWIEIGGLLQERNAGQSRILGGSQAQSSENRSVFMKVELAD